MAANENELGERAARFLKAEMKRHGVTYAELARRLEERAMKETEASITSKLARGTFSATFMLAAVAALGIDQIDIQGICENRIAASARDA